MNNYSLNKQNNTFQINSQTNFQLNQPIKNREHSYNNFDLYYLAFSQANKRLPLYNNLLAEYNKDLNVTKQSAEYHKNLAYHSQHHILQLLNNVIKQQNNSSVNSYLPAC
jgi:hypothetical protein